MRYNDIRDGTDIVSKEIMPKYKASLAKKGMFGADGLYATFFAVKQQKAISAVHGAHTAWCVDCLVWEPRVLLMHCTGRTRS